MADLTKERVLEALSGIRLPDGGTTLTDAGIVGGIVIKGANVGFSLEIDPARAEAMEPVRRAAEAAVRALPGVTSATAVLTAERSGGHAHGHDHAPRATRPQGPPAPQGVPGVRSIIAVASGKGGVGKSTTAINLALGLAAIGQRVGILDADIYGPSIPRMVGATGRPTSPDGKRLEPMRAWGIPTMSMGYLVEEDTPMIWRGPMVQSAIQQMLSDVSWGELDVLVVDLPPGTGDAQLTMSQKVPLTGAVIVSTPQDIALLDARKAIQMFRKVDVPILGIVENMSYFCCPNCGHRSDIFAHGGARDCAASYGVPFLGEVPLDIRIRETSDGGTPIVASDPASHHAEVYRTIAAGVRQQMDAMTGAAKPFPTIVWQ
ncbi:MAG TPA: iron-sulfur cluster carrier protein ApbC [Geminicoccus sp.]|uniref:iron-sulfur cluster carrier protein ApbC n=1 Tax=Geminicoccus sp. TaxID=2024832 RepID=UPI002E346C27|nr:iron-sulfur cluster carrier protein ApbC [Geminicoccus sp.]HEX2527280.1 iron-sulfur cluster carrier protein ApbC [Geminicoccus sp.]